MSSLLRIPYRHRIPRLTHRIVTQRCKYSKDVPRPVPPNSSDGEPTVEVFSSKARAPANPLFNDQPSIPRRTFATEQLPRPPPSSSTEPVVETFENASKPKPYQYHGRPPPRTDLPLQKKRWPLITAAIALGIVGWAAFFMIATNQEKLSSSVVRQILRTVKDNQEIKEMLGDAIRPQPEWWLNGDPWVEGAINMMQGNVDVSFRLKGHKGSGTLYFTSVRKAKGEPFTILRFRVRGDDGTVVNVPTS